MGSAPLAVGVSLGGGFPWSGGIPGHSGVSRSTRVSGDDNLRVVLQLIKAAVCQHVPRGQTGDLCSPAVGHTRFNRAHMCGVVLQNIDKGSLPVMLDCRSWN